MRQLVIETEEGERGAAFPIRRAQTTLGRRPHNDIVVEDRLVSGQHAVLTLSGHDVVVEDLNSTNGTFVNGVRVQRHQLAPNDLLEVGSCRLRYLSDGLAEPSFSYDKTVVLTPANTGPGTGPAAERPNYPYTVPATLPKPLAMVQVLSGDGAPSETLLTKVVTTLGKPGTQTVAICRRPAGFVLTLVAGSGPVRVNGQVLQAQETTLKHGDVIEFAETRLAFVCP